MTEQDRETHNLICQCDRILETQALAAQDSFRLATAQNVARNGRLFCVLLFILSIVSGSISLAGIAALPVGLSCLVDGMKPGWPRVIASASIYALAAYLAIFLILNLR